MGTQSSNTTTGPAVSDSSEDSDSNNKESAQKEEVASTSCSSTFSSSDSASDASGLGLKAKVADTESKLEKAKTDNSEKASCESIGGSRSQDGSDAASASSDGIARTNPSDIGKIKNISESTNENAYGCDEKSTTDNSIDGSPMDDILSLSSGEAPDDKVGRNAFEETDLGQSNADGDPLLDVPSAISSAVSSRAISPILGPIDFGGDNSTSSHSNDNNGSPRVAARASDREFSGDVPDGSEKTQTDGDHSLTEKPKPAAMVATKKEEDLPPLGQEQHLDEPEEFAWLRPLKCIQARGGYHDDPEKSMTNATVVSYPAPAGELFALEKHERGECEYQEYAKWYIRIYWVMSCYKQWLPCEWCREEFGRGERKRTTTNRYTTGAIAAAKRNDLLKKSAPQTHSALGSKSCHIEIDDDNDGDNDDDDDDGNAAAKIPRTKGSLHLSLVPPNARKTPKCLRTTNVLGSLL